MSIRLSGKEKILLWLLRFVPKKGDYIQPLEVSQKGIAMGLNMLQTNVSRELSELLKEGFIDRISAHFRGTKRKMNAYNLSPDGLKVTREISSKVNDSVVTVRLKGKIEEMAVTRVRTILRGKGLSPSHFAIATCFENVKTDVAFDELMERISIIQQPAEQIREGKKKYQHHLGGIIEEGEFIGRKKVIDKINIILAKTGFRVIGVMGVAGMGKSALGREVIKYAKSDFNIFYYRFRRWDRFDSLAGEVLEYVGKTGTPDGDRLIRSLMEFCRDNNLLMMLDDVHLVTDDVNDFIEDLSTYSDKLQGMKLILLSRKMGQMERYTSAKNSGKFTRVLLEPFEAEECGELASIVGYGERWKVDRETGKMIRDATGGIPLLVELLHKEEIVTGKITAKGTGMIEKEILKNMEDHNAMILKMLSLCTLPVEKDIMKNSERYISELTDRLLLERTTEGLYQVHDHIKEVIRKQLGFRERKKLMKGIIAYLEGVLRRGTEGDFLPAPMAEDLDLYFLEYIHHNIEIGEVEKGLIAIREVPIKVTEGPFQEVLEEFLERMELKLGGKNGLIELLRSGMALDEDDVEGAREHYKKARELYRTDQKKEKGAVKEPLLSDEMFEGVANRIEMAERGPGKLKTMMEKADDPQERVRIGMAIASAYARDNGKKEAEKWLLKTSDMINELPSDLRATFHFKAGVIYIKLNYIKEAEHSTREGLRTVSMDDNTMRGSLGKLLGQIHFRKGSYGKAEEKFNRAKTFFRRTGSLFQLADSMLWEVKSILARSGTFKKAMTVSFLDTDRPSRKIRSVLDDCITRIREALLILRGSSRKIGALSRLLGREIFDERNLSLWRQLLVLRCSLEWLGSYTEYALETASDIITLGKKTRNADMLIEGSIIKARILAQLKRKKEAREILEELMKKKGIQDGPKRNALSYTLSLMKKSS